MLQDAIIIDLKRYYTEKKNIDNIIDRNNAIFIFY